MVVYSDGAARGNPGPAGAGAVVCGAQGEVLRRLARPLGNATNNVAEYEGAILGLEAARDLGATEVELRADSELMVRQLDGRYRVKAPHLVPLHQRAQALLASFTRARVRHVPREQNRLADRMANEAIDGPAPEQPVMSACARELLEQVLKLDDGDRELFAQALSSHRGNHR